MDTFQDDIYVLADYPPPYTHYRSGKEFILLLVIVANSIFKLSTNNLSAFFKYSGKNIQSVNLGVLWYRWTLLDDIYFQFASYANYRPSSLNLLEEFLKGLRMFIDRISGQQQLLIVYPFCKIYSSLRTLNIHTCKTNKSLKLYD